MSAPDEWFAPRGKQRIDADVNIDTMLMLQRAVLMLLGMKTVGSPASAVTQLAR